MFLKEICVVWVVWVTISHGSPPQNESYPPEPKMADGRKPNKELGGFSCTNSEDCQESQYCGGRSRKRCIDCTDCDKYQRKPKRSYEGNTCAQNAYECGECNPSYQEVGGVCIPVGTVTPSTDLPIVNMNPFQQHEEVAHQAQINGNGLIVTGGIVCLALFIIGAVVSGIYANKKHSKSTNRASKLEEEAGLTSYNGPCDVGPTAPPAADEYNRPPPYTNLFSSPLYPKTNTVINEQSSSFSSEYDETTGTYVNSGRDIGDQTDGRRNDGENERIQPEMENMPTHNNATDAANGLDSNGRRAVVPSRRNRNASANSPPVREIMPYGPPSSTPVRPLPGTYSNDPVHGYVNVQFAIQAGLQWGFSPNQAYDEHSRTVISAPPSPSSRYIDSTHVDFDQLGQTFAASNSSVDSGTGTSEGNERSIPSGSGSDLRGLSDVEPMEESMYEEEDHVVPVQSRHSGAEFHQVPAIHNFNQTQLRLDIIPQPFTANENGITRQMRDDMRHEQREE